MKEERQNKRPPPFRKRHFKTIGQAFSEFNRLLQSRSHNRDARRSPTITAEFRERLMLAVTEVNQCRYCSYAHTRMALQSGLPSLEIQKILNHDLQDSPAEEVPAILYAQHWAEADGHPEMEIRRNLEIQYGTARAAKIDRVLAMIRAANLLGNSLDYLLYRVSFGRWGN
jgi:AhpD family alkylhydroperoxidase